MSDDDFIWRFTPSRTAPELLEAIFVQRESLLRDLIERVTESATTGSKHHVLLIGPRGFGKTHLITLLNYRLGKDSSLRARIRVAWLLEDETITSFVQLLKRIYEILAHQYPDEFPLEWLNGLLDESPKRIQRQLQDKLIQAFAEKTLLLCVENLDNLFSGLGADGQHEWRAFLQEHPFTTIMASTQRLFADVKTRDKPFFGFFSPVHLEPLNVKDAVELLRRVAKNRTANDLVAFLDSAEGRSRVRALHHLAGGNHRIYVVLSGFITRESLDDLVGPFQKMADDLTPYYQERLRWLSPQQRQIVEYLCSQDRPCMPKQIARQLLAAENTVSSQLKKLLEIGYVLRSQRGRESLYELAEPLMRLASEVKEQQRRPLQMLVNFLRVWYRPDDLPGLLQTAGTESLRRHIAAAIEAWQTSPDPRIQVLDDAIEKAREENREDELLDLLEEKSHTTNEADDWFELAYAQVEIRKDYEHAVASYDRGLNLRPDQVWAWNQKGQALWHLDRYEEAIVCYDKAIRTNSNDAWSWCYKGEALQDMHRYEEAIACYDTAIQADPNHAWSWYYRGKLLQYLRRYEEAICSFNKAIQVDSNHVWSWHHKGELFQYLHRYEEAIDSFDKAIQADPNHAWSWYGKGRLLQDLNRYDEAIVCFDTTIKLYPEYASPWFNWSEALLAMNQWDKALMQLRKAMQQFQPTPGHDAASMIEFLRTAFAAGNNATVQEFAQLYVGFDAITRLGDGLVRSLAKIDVENATETSLRKWRDFWNEFGAPYPEMQIPLRLFGVGIEYLIKQDRKVLLDLVLAERQILEQALEIEVPPGG